MLGGYEGIFQSARGGVTDECYPCDVHQLEGFGAQGIGGLGMTAKIDVMGQRFGKLTVVAESRRNGEFAWLCKCDCGGETIQKSSDLRKGKVKSCGCLGSHGMSETSEFKSWVSAKSRCYKASDVSFHNYGGRGITMYDEWKDDFMVFYKYMGPKPDDGQRWTLGRIDNDKGYEPGNVRWETDEEQNRNRRKPVTNKTGVVGVMRQEHVVDGRAYPQYRAKVKLNGKVKMKAFSVKKFGEDEAFRLACEWRTQEIKKLEDVGVFYAESHGK